MKPDILVLGATGGIGYAVTKNLIDRNIPVAILARDERKANRLFDHSALVTVHTGDVQDTALLNRIAAGKTIIFHGVNYAYHEWFGNIDTATEKIIGAAAQNGATLVYPGSVYNFGNTRLPIHEDTPQRPCSRKGALRVKLEEMMESAVLEGRCKAIVVRLPDFWGPNVVNHGTIPIFENALRKKPIYYLGNPEAKHQMVFTRDAAEIIVMLMLIKDRLKPFEVVNYGGETFNSAYDLLHQVADAANAPRRVWILGRITVWLMAIFMPVMREVKEMLYLFENPILLDDRKVHRLFPHFRRTPTREAIAETLDWFTQHRLAK